MVLYYSINILRFIINILGNNIVKNETMDSIVKWKNEAFRNQYINKNTFWVWISLYMYTTYVHWRKPFYIVFNYVHCYTYVMVVVGFFLFCGRGSFLRDFVEENATQAWAHVSMAIQHLLRPSQPAIRGDSYSEGATL